MNIVAMTADELFDNVVDDMLREDDCDLKNCKKEIVNANLTLMDPTRNTMCNCRRNMSLRYAIGELLWYQSRNNTCKSIAPFSKFWERLADDGEHVNSNYGWCIHDKFGFDQWNMVKQILLTDHDSRQAVMHIKEARNITESPTKDLNCTISLQFILRNNKLDLITTMRSNDIWLGLPYDVFNFTCMQIQMAMELGVEIGVYHHNVGSLHMYEKDYLKLVGGQNATE